jgi:hypothetical protein
MGFFSRTGATARFAEDLPTEDAVESYTSHRSASGAGMGELGRAGVEAFGAPSALPTWLLLLDLGVGEWRQEVRSAMVDDMIGTIVSSGALRTASVTANLLRITVDEREGPTPPAYLRGAYAEFSHGAAQVDPTVVEDEWDLGYYYFTRLDEAVRAGDGDSPWMPEPFIGAFKACWSDDEGDASVIGKTLQFIVRPLARAINDGQLPPDHVDAWLARRVTLDARTFDEVPPTPPPTSHPMVPCPDADARLSELGFTTAQIAELRRLDLRRHIDATVRHLHPSGRPGDALYAWTRLRAAAALLNPTSPSALRTFRSELYELVEGIADYEPSADALAPVLRAAHSVVVPVVAAAEDGRPMMRQQAAMYLATLADSPQPPDDELISRVVALFDDGDLRGVSPHASGFLEPRLASKG